MTEDELKRRLQELLRDVAQLLITNDNSAGTLDQAKSSLLETQALQTLAQDGSGFLKQAFREELLQDGAPSVRFDGTNLLRQEPRSTSFQHRRNTGRRIRGPAQSLPF